MKRWVANYSSTTLGRKRTTASWHNDANRNKYVGLDKANKKRSVKPGKEQNAQGTSKKE